MDKKWDVIIVGAGPAGTTLGYELCKTGIKTLIIEKEVFPRYKACGGGVTIKTTKLLDINIQPVIQDTISQATLTYKMGNECSLESKSPIAQMVNREELDSLLLNRAVRAGCEFVDGSKVVEIEVRRGEVRVATNHSNSICKIIAGADGANSIISRKTGLNSNVVNGVSIESEVNVPARELALWSQRVLLDLGSIKGGYGWIFPKRDHLSIGVGGPGIKASDLNSYFTRFTEHWSNKMKGYKITHKVGHRLPTRKIHSAICTEHVLLVGDAAGLIEPMSGEGIYNAIRSAQLAAQSIIAYLNNVKGASLSNYQYLVDKEIMPEIQRAKAFIRIFNLMPFYFFSKLTTSKRLWDATIDLLMGRTSYRKIGETVKPFDFIFDHLAW